MKQHISPEQLNELSEKGKERLRKWWKPQEGDWVYTHDWVTEEPIYAKDANWDYNKVYNTAGEQIGIAAPSPEITGWTEENHKGYKYLLTWNSDHDGYYDSRKEKITVLLAEKERDLPLLSIGQMIEFLDKHKWWENNLMMSKKYMFSRTTVPSYWSVKNEKGYELPEPQGKYRELCDALWYACKEVLEK